MDFFTRNKTGLNFLFCAALASGVIGFSTVARAEEKTALMTSLSATTISGYVDTFTPGPRPWSRTPTQPAIKSIHTKGNKITIVARVPAGTKQATLESSCPGQGAWKPRAVRHLNGKTTQLVFQLKKSATNETFRITAQREKLPAKFYHGRHSFAASKTRANGGALPSGAPGGLSPAGENNGAPSPALRSVVESDIWKINGNRLYFFNQYRGLQVIDITNPDSPSILGTLDLPAVGEQMYLLDDAHLILLAQNWDDENFGSETRVLLVDVSGAKPVVTADLTAAGFVTESRLVGSALYLAGETSRKTDDEYEYGTQVSSFDFSDLSAPVARGTIWISGYGNVIHATDQFLFVAVQDADNWMRSRVHCIDISAPNGSMNETASIQTAGQITDKFKMNFAGGVLTTISRAEGISDEGGWNTAAILETFSLANPAAPALLGQLPFAENENLTATRFDGNRVYATTAVQIDPLFIIDISNPSQPAIVGELSIPGWQNFIYPLGTRLISIGQFGDGDGRTAVSLFDVSNPAAPSLLSKVALGENFSWSEASYNEKALNVLPEAGLILVPFQGGLNGFNGYSSHVQLIDLATNSLTLRGAINHQMQARRATVSHDRVVSVSGYEFLSVDANDRDNPVVKTNFALAWPVDRVFLSGDFVLEIGSANYNDASPAVRIAPADTPNSLVAQFALTNLNILGATVQSNLLYVLQGEDFFIFPPRGIDNGTNSDDPGIQSDFSLHLSVIDLSHLPDLEIAGQTDTSISNFPGFNLQALWPKPGVLVWAGASQRYWPFVSVLAPAPGPIGLPVLSNIVFLPPITRPLRTNAIILPVQPPQAIRRSTSVTSVTQPAAPNGIFPGPSIGFGWPWFWNNGELQMLAFDVNDNSAPAFLSNVTIATNGWPGGKMFATNGLVYASHAEQKFSPPEVIPVSTGPTGVVFPGSTTGTGIGLPPLPQIFPPTNDSQQPKTPEDLAREAAIAEFNLRQNLANYDFTWSETNFLDVVDFTEPAAPTVRDPIDISGPLAGISRGGAIVYTQAQGRKGAALDALAYDGAETFLVATLSLKSEWATPSLVIGETIFITKTAEKDDQTSGVLQSWKLNDAGKFVRLDTLDLPAPIYNLAAFGNMLAAQGSRAISLIDASNPAALTVAGGASGGWIWPNLSGADGALGRGLWAPLGDYGVLIVDLVNPGNTSGTSSQMMNVVPIPDNPGSSIIISGIEVFQQLLPPQVLPAIPANLSVELSLRPH